MAEKLCKIKRQQIGNTKTTLNFIIENEYYIYHLKADKSMNKYNSNYIHNTFLDETRLEIKQILLKNI
jgi:hypothetical protein